MQWYKCHDGEHRALGHVPNSVVLKSAGRARVIDRSKWVEFDDTDKPTPVGVLDQNGKGACNGHAAVTSLEIARVNAGYKHVPLSPWFVYAILCGGWDRGSNIGDALELLSGKGAPPFDAVPYGTINPARLSDASHQAAKRYRIEIGQHLTTPDEIGTAVQLRLPFNFSLCVGNGFDDLDANGCVRLGRGSDNHAVCGTGRGMKRTRDGRWVIHWQNSWGTRWGKQGFAWIYLDDMAKSQYFEAYTVNAVAVDPSDPESVPPAMS